jgi:aldehyde dehydrogenase (NAD+)
VRSGSRQLAQIEARNVGKPIGDARDEIGIVANTLEYWGGAANKIFGETVPVQDPGSTSRCANRSACAR